MVKVLNESDAELSARLIVALDELNPNSVTVKRLESLLASVRQVNKQAVDAMYTSLSDELLDFAKHEVSYQLSLFDSLLPGPVLNHFPLASITKEQVYAAAMAQPFQGRLLRDWAENIEADRMTRIINTVKTAIWLAIQLNRWRGKYAAPEQETIKMAQSRRAGRMSRRW